MPKVMVNFTPAELAELDATARGLFTLYAKRIDRVQIIRAATLHLLHGSTTPHPDKEGATT